MDDDRLYENHDEELPTTKIYDGQLFVTLIGDGIVNAKWTIEYQPEDRLVSGEWLQDVSTPESMEDPTAEAQTLYGQLKALLFPACGPDETPPLMVQLEYGETLAQFEHKVTVGRFR